MSDVKTERNDAQLARSLALQIWLRCNAGTTYDQDEATKLILEAFQAIRGERHE